MKEVSYIQRNPMAPKDAWDSLSIADKAAMMRVAVQNGITNLNDIRQKYNEFAEGGNIYDGTTESSNQMKRPITTGGAGYVPETNIDIKRRLYDNLSPIGYENLTRVPEAVLLNKPDYYHNTMKDMPVLDEIYAQYLGIPEKERHFNRRLEQSEYKPTIGGEDVIYYKLPQKTIDGRTIVGDHHRHDGSSNTSIDSMVFDATYMNPGTNKQQVNTELGYYTVGRGRDNQGDYASYYDKWDLNPFSGGLQNKTSVPAFIRKALSNVNMDFGTPVHIYDRVYFDDYYGINGKDRGGHYLPEVIVTGKKKSLGGNLYAGGSYMPSEGIKKRISKWEGKAMTGAKDPLSGKFLKNNSFESEAAAFTRAIPESIREQVLSNPELADNLFSYSYNVGAPKFKKRVVKALEDYYAGKGTAKKIADSMWASGDVKLRGLRNRRAEEKKGVLNALRVDVPAMQVPELPVSTAVVNPFIIPAENTTFFPQVTPIEDNYVEVQEITPEQRRAEQVRNTFNAINNYNMMMDMLSVPNNPQPMYVPKNAPYVVRGLGGPIVDAAMNEYKKGGGIHIKHPGRLTALKKRTGKTEAELYNDGNPAHKKMVVFARNARKFKHGLGGNLFSGE